MAYIHGRTILKRPIQVLGVLLLTVAASAAQAASTDPLTHLPLYPNMEFVSKNSQDVCGTTVSSATYSPRSGNLAAVDSYYAGHLHGFTMVHGKLRNYPYDVFANADRTMSITVLGAVPNTVVQGVVYHRNAKPAKVVNVENWLFGGSPLCQ